VSEELSQPKRSLKRNQLSPEAMERASAAKKSYWPFLLAVAISISLVGIVLFSNIVLIIGIVLVVGAVIGWGLERH
jgi:hypothetical protein